MKLFSTKSAAPKEEAAEEETPEAVETAENPADGDENRVYEMPGDDSAAVDSTPTFLAYIRKGFWD